MILMQSHSPFLLFPAKFNCETANAPNFACWVHFSAFVLQSGLLFCSRGFRFGFGYRTFISAIIFRSQRCNVQIAQQVLYSSSIQRDLAEYGAASCSDDVLAVIHYVVFERAAHFEFMGFSIATGFILWIRRIFSIGVSSL